MMGPYSKKFGGRVKLDQIMPAANINYWDLLFLNTHADANGRNTLY